MSFRVGSDTLHDLSRSIQIPEYDRSVLRARILHLGMGNFHRAHQARYTDQLLREGIGDWAIAGAGIKTIDRELAKRLASQDFLYTLVPLGSPPLMPQVIGSVIDYVLGDQNSEPVVTKIADVTTKIVSLTVTEDGYTYDNGTRRLDLTNPSVLKDLEHSEQPQTVVGLLAAGLRERKRMNAGRITILSCDNIPENGNVARTALLDFVRLGDPAVLNWIEENVTFPLTMVDRITPQTTADHRAYLEQEYGVMDACPVFCEDFTQWVIEDNFASGRPQWERAGVQFVPNVQPYELLKLRLLNGSHSALSYPALLLGYTLVHDSLADQDLLQFVRLYMREITRVVPSISDVDVGLYTESLIKRFSNPMIADQLMRLANSGSRKFPNSVFEPAAEALDRNLPIQMVSLAVATWIFYCAEAEEGRAPKVMDPMEKSLFPIAAETMRRPYAIFETVGLIPEALARNARFTKAVIDALSHIKRRGIRDTLQRYIRENIER